MKGSESVAHASVVICTRNREDKIGNAVRNVLASTYPHFDLTIIDQSTSDATERAIRDVAGDDERVRYVHIDRPGLSGAYNQGIARTTGEILAFTDDDCLVPPDWLSRIVDAFESEPDGDLLYGQVIPLDQDRAALTPFLRIHEPTRLSKQDGFKVFGMGANFAARRRLFDTIGGFDEVLGGGGPLKSSQDYDVAYRAYRAGRVTLLRPEVTLRHDGEREEADWPSLLTAYGIGDGAFYTKHIRCRDPYALVLFSRNLSLNLAKWVAKVLLRRHPENWNYVAGMITGMRMSFKFEVDRAARLYRAGATT